MYCISICIIYIYVYSIWYIWIKEMFGHKRSIYIYINWINIYINLDIISIYQSLHPEILDQRFFAIAPRSHAESIGRCSAAARQDLCHGFLGMVNLHTANIGYPFRMVIFIDFWDYVFCHCFSHTRIYIYIYIYDNICKRVCVDSTIELWWIVIHKSTNTFKKVRVPFWIESWNWLADRFFLQAIRLGFAQEKCKNSQDLSYAFWFVGRSKTMDG